jgi:hypothetical protein
MADIVKSVEFIEVNTTGTSTSYSLTKDQDYTNCVPFLSVHGGQDYQDTKCWDCYFSGTQASGTINFERANGRSTEGYVKCFVVEFDSNEVYVEQGTFNIDSTNTDTVTTSGVFNPERTAFTHYWKSTSSSTAYVYHLCRGRATASGTLDFYRSHVTAALNGHWFLFEAKNDQFFVEHMESSGSTTNIYTRLSRSYDPFKTFFIASTAGGSTSAGYLDRALIYVLPANRDVVGRNKASSTSTVYTAAQVIEFQDTNIHVPYANAIELDATSKTQSWGAAGYTQIAVDLDYSMVINTASYFDRCNATSTSEIDNSASSVKFIDTTSIQMEKNSHTTASTYPSIFVVDWKGYTVSGTTNGTIDPDISFVKSVQNMRITAQEYVGLGYLTKDQDVDNCIIFASNYAGESTTNSLNPGLHDVFISDTGVVGVYRFSTSSSGVVDISVVEFYPDQVRVQSGTFTGDLTTEVSVPLSTSVDSGKSFLVASWSSYNTSNNMTYHNIRCRIVDSDNVGFYCITGSHNHGTWFLAEDITTNNSCFDVLHWIDDSTGDIIHTTDDRKFPESRSFSLFSYAGGYSGEYGERSCLRGYYYNASIPIYLDVKTASATKYHAVQSVRIIRSGRHYTHQWDAEILPASTTDTETLPSLWAGETNITSFNTNLINVGRNAFTTQNDCGAMLSSIRISDYGTLTATAQRATTSTYTLFSSYCFINWVGSDPQGLTATTPTRSLIRSINKFSYTGDSERYTWYFDKHQDGANSLPLATYNSYAATNRAEENQRIVIVDHEAGYPHSLSMHRGTGDKDTNDTTIVYLVEFDDEQVRVQSGTYGTTSTDFTVTIDTVDIDKAFLVFYNSTTSDSVWTACNLSGTIESSTSLRFRRTSSAGTITVAWYVVECLGDQWSTQHIITDTSTANSIYNTFESIPYLGKYWVFNSYTGSYGSNVYAQRNLCRTVALADGSVEIQRASGNANTISYFSSEVVKFNDNIDIRTFYNTINQTAATSDTDVLFDPVISQQRSIVFNPQANNHGEINTSTALDNAREAFYTQELVDFDTAQPKIRVTKGASTYSTQSCACITEFPEYNMYFMEGYTKEQGAPVVREVQAYRSSTGELVDSTTSASGTGYFFLESKYGDEHHVVCLDDVAGVDYNHLIYGKLYPTVISGTFAYNEGLTPSGVLGEIPLGRAS